MSDYGGAGWGLGPNTEAIREWRMRVERRAMTTRIDDILDRFATGFQTVEDIQYLRDLHASHEALLKAAKNAKTVLSDYDALPGERDRAIDGMARSIRAAEELSR